jgi:hypothetical protein
MQIQAPKQQQQQQQHSLVHVQQQLLLPQASKVDALSLQPLRLTRALRVQQVHLRVCGEDW